MNFVVSREMLDFTTQCKVKRANKKKQIPSRALGVRRNIYTRSLKRLSPKILLFFPLARLVRHLRIAKEFRLFGVWEWSFFSSWKKWEFSFFLSWKIVLRWLELQLIVLRFMIYRKDDFRYSSTNKQDTKSNLLIDARRSSSASRKGLNENPHPYRRKSRFSIIFDWFLTHTRRASTLEIRRWAVVEVVENFLLELC